MKSSTRSPVRGVRKEKNRSPLENHRDDLARCVKCGSCSAVCPTYLHERNESFSARGRMALVKAVREGRLDGSRIFNDRLAACTACLACEASCPSGVRVTEIIQAAKEQAAEEGGAGPVSAVVSGVVKRPVLFRAATLLVRAALHYSGGRGASPGFKVRSSEKDGAKGAQKGQFRGRVVFFPGCAVEYLQPDIGTATAAVLDRLGYEVVIPGGLKCCGRPLLSLGDRRGAAELAAHNCDILAGFEADAVVTACASCGLTFKREYPKLLRPGAKKPVLIDIHEFLSRELAEVRFAPIQRSVTVHDPCHLGRGQGLSGAVRDLLRRVPGLTIVEMNNADRCCGFGGVMRVTHRRLSDGIAEEKAKSIIATNAPTVAAACPGCRMQITDALRRAGSDVAVLHPVQILAEALSSAE